MGVKGTNGRRLEVVERDVRKDVPAMSDPLPTSKDASAGSKLCDETERGIIGGRVCWSAHSSFCPEGRRSRSEGVLRGVLENGEGGGDIDVGARTSIILAIRSQWSARADVGEATRFMGSLRGRMRKEGAKLLRELDKVNEGDWPTLLVMGWRGEVAQTKLATCTPDTARQRAGD